MDLGFLAMSLVQVGFGLSCFLASPCSRGNRYAAGSYRARRDWTVAAIQSGRWCLEATHFTSWDKISGWCNALQNEQDSP